MSIPLIVLIILIYKRVKENVFGKILIFILGFLAFICLMVALSSYSDLRDARKIERLQEEAKKEELEFSEIDLGKRALRAEKLFKMNQKELMRYYDLNIAQTKFLSVLGIIMIFFGVIIIVASVVLYSSIEIDKIALLVGSISGIIVDFIGAIFIKMYTQNIEAAVKFHAKFADSNNLLLANSIANKIDNDDLREDTLAELAKGIVVQ